MGEHVHFDADAIIAAQKVKRERTLEDLMARAKTPEERDLLFAQKESFAAQDVMIRSLIRMKNEGQSPMFIGQVIGAFLSNVMTSTLQTVDHPDCAIALFKCLNIGLAGMSGELPKGVVNSGGTYAGTRGGRA